jgi:hypothetical protein
MGRGWGEGREAWAEAVAGSGSRSETCGERLGLAEEPALSERNPQLPQGLELFEGIEALSDDAGADVFRHRLERA